MDDGPQTQPDIPYDKLGAVAANLITQLLQLRDGSVDVLVHHTEL